MNKQLPSYSIAIRTLGKAGPKYQNLLDSILLQTHKPERIIVYIAQGYKMPSETVGIEEYVYVPKGMVAQRALPYKEISSDYILLLDDDACLEQDSVERLFNGLMEYPTSECIAVNSFGNHLWTYKEKLKYALFGTTPHKDDGYAFRVKKSISYSYNNNPNKDVLKTESFAGLAFLIKAESLRSISFEDEIWMDEFGYAMGDDLVLSYKLHMNGYPLLIHYNSGIIHQDAQTGHLDANFSKKLMQSTSVLYVVWHRIRISNTSFLKKVSSTNCYILSVIWKIMIYALVSVYKLDAQILIAYIKGIIAGIKYTRTDRYLALPPFIMNR